MGKRTGKFYNTFTSDATGMLKESEYRARAQYAESPEFNQIILSTHHLKTPEDAAAVRNDQSNKDPNIS